MKEILKGNNNQVSWLPSVTAITFSVFPCPRAPAHRKAAGYLVWGAVGFWLLPAPSAGAPAAGRAVAGSPGRSPCVPASCLWVSAGLALRGFKKWRERQVSNNLGNGLPLGFSSPGPKKKKNLKFITKSGWCRTEIQTAMVYADRIDGVLRGNPPMKREPWLLCNSGTPQ